MTYSLVGSTTLAYDLARLPHGHQAAAVLRTTLRCDARDIERIAALHPGTEFVDEWEQIASDCQPERMNHAIGYSVDTLAERIRGNDAPGITRQLGNATVGDLAAVDALLRDELLDPSIDADIRDLAADVIMGAVASSYCVDMAPGDRRKLTVPFIGARLSLADETVCTGHDSVDRLLLKLRAMDEGRLSAWRLVINTRARKPAAWAASMHEATWAAHLTDRLQLAMDAQLAAVCAFRAAGFTSTDASHGIWNAISGAVAATVVNDLLPDEDEERLMGPWRATDS